MKTDAEVHLMLRERHKGKTQAQAAARAGMHPNTARKYQRRGALPSQLKQPRTYRTRSDPFADDFNLAFGGRFAARGFATGAHDGEERFAAVNAVPE